VCSANAAHTLLRLSRIHDQVQETQHVTSPLHQCHRNEGAGDAHDNTANNLANVNTTAFKRSRMDFADLYYSNQRAPGSSVSTSQVSPTGLQIGNGVRVVATSKSFVNGTAEQTGNPLDVAIEGDGFFPVVVTNGETRYTRAGSFKLDNQGRLTTPDGFVVQPESQSTPAATSVRSRSARTVQSRPVPPARHKAANSWTAADCHVSESRWFVERRK